MDEYTITHLDGNTGPTWTCDDYQEAVALAEEHGYTLLYTAEFIDPTGEKDSYTKLVVA